MRPCRPRRPCRRAGPRSRSGATSPSAAARSTGSSLAKPSADPLDLAVDDLLGRPRSRRGRPRGPCSRRASPSGRTPISNLKPSGSPSSSGAETISMLGSPTGLTPEASRARSYHSGSDSRIASSRTAPKPSRWITSEGGALPLRKPGRRISRARRAGGALDAASRRRSAGTSTSTSTREPGSSVTVVCIGADPRGIDSAARAMATGARCGRSGERRSRSRRRGRARAGR